MRSLRFFIVEESTSVLLLCVAGFTAGVYTSSRKSYPSKIKTYVEGLESSLKVKAGPQTPDS